jgi:multiple sugar transport system substrate-binding protein
METQGTWGWRFDYGPEGATPMDNILEKVGTWAFPSRDGSRPPHVVGTMGSVFMINAKTKNPDVAWEVFKRTLSAEGIGRFCLSVGAISPRKDARTAFPAYGANPQLLADEDRLDNLLDIPPFEGQQAVQMAVAQATEHLLLGRTAEQAMTVYTNMVQQAFRKKKDQIVLLPLD